MSRRRKRKKRPPSSQGVAPVEAPRAEPASVERPSVPWRSRKVALPGLLLLALAAVALLARSRLFDAGEREPLSFVIVTADTFRADRIGAYGGKVPTPNLDRLAETGALFESAVTAVPVTLPSHASLFTGTYPLYHGVRDNGGRPLDGRFTTLAETLRDAGWATGAFVGAFVLDSRWGLDQGFDVYSDRFDETPAEGANLGETQRPGDEVLDDALPWIASVKGRRFFAWVHLFDAHTPYDPPEPFRSGTSPSELYDGEIAYVDHLVGRLQEALATEGLASRTAILFVGDHGESLGEHGEETHGFFVYDATMRVPMIWNLPGGELGGRRVTELVRTIDVLPTVLELAGVEPPEDGQGRSLLALARGRSSGPERLAYGESQFPAHYGWAPLASLRSGSLHLIDAPRPELYDVASDPGETENLASTRAGTVRQLLDELHGIEEASAGPIPESEPDASVDPETEAKLRALGYVGGHPAASSNATRADPKDKIHLFLRIREAAAAADAGRRDEAARVIERVLDEDPEIAEAHRMLGDYRLAEGRPEEAAQSYESALRIDERYAPAVFGLASAFHAMGRLDDAASGFERVLSLDPGSASALFALARVRLEQRRYEEAARLLADSHVPESERAARLRLEAEADAGLGRLDEARALLEEAVAASPGDASGYLQLGVLAEKRGDARAALAAYEKAVELDPASYEAHFNAAKLLGPLGRPEEMMAHLEKSIEANPSFGPGYLYLANAVLERGDPQRAVSLAERGLSLEKEPTFAALGHFVLADAYERLGRREDASRELAEARRLQVLARKP